MLLAEAMLKVLHDEKLGFKHPDWIGGQIRFDRDSLKYVWDNGNEFHLTILVYGQRICDKFVTIKPKTTLADLKPGNKFLREGCDIEFTFLDSRYIQVVDHKYIYMYNGSIYGSNTDDEVTLVKE